MEGDEHFAKGHPQMAPPAQQQGRLLAKNMKNLIDRKPLRPFHYFDKGSMATIGRNKAVVDMKSGVRFQGAFAWYVWMFVHLMSMVGFRNKVFTFLSWMWNYFSFDRSNRLIIGRNEEKFNPEEIKSESKLEVVK
jgi:NADH dehydrogenase